MTPRLATVLLFTGLFASAASARAEPQTAAASLRGRVAARYYAFETTLGTGVTQGFGKLEEGVDMRRVATPGIAFDLGLAYRSTPEWAFGVAGQYQEFRAERAAGARGVTVGVVATYHLAPLVRSDPWVQLGTGYRLLWEAHHEPEPNLLTHGFQLVRVAVGLDLRPSEDVGLSPVAGIDLGAFLWQNGAGPLTIESPRLNAFAFLGVQGRFDDFGVLAEARRGAMTARRP